jgi:hypothetical protein
MALSLIHKIAHCTKPCQHLRFPLQGHSNLAGVDVVGITFTTGVLAVRQIHQVIDFSMNVTGFTLSQRATVHAFLCSLQSCTTSHQEQQAINQ